MVFAWLITQRQSFRENSTHLLPFKVRDTIRRRQSLRGGSREQENLENQEDGEDMQIVGVLELSATSQYDHLQDLSADEREQYYHWACRLKVDPAGLWRMHVENCHVFDGRWKLSTYCQRNVSKLYRRLEHLHAIGLTADVGELPAWAPDPHEDVITFGLCLPSGFIAKISSGAWDRLVLPSPFMHGPFGAPKWFQNSLEPDLAQAVANTQDGAAAVQTNAFDLSSRSAMLHDLRRVCTGQMARRELLTWILQLQALDDQLYRAHVCAADKSIERMINIMLLCDLLKNSDQLKKAMIKACEILLPGGLSQQLRDCMNTGPR